MGKIKIEIKTLYIEADEDYVANQYGSCIQLRLVYVHERREKIGKKRNKLKKYRGLNSYILSVTINQY